MRNHAKLEELYPSNAKLKRERFYATLAKGFFLALIALLLVLSFRAASAQTVTQVYDPADLRKRVVTLADWPDGGAELSQLCAELPAQDGGDVKAVCYYSIDITGPARRAGALNLLDIAGQEWLRRSRIQNDGGAP